MRPRYLSIFAITVALGLSAAIPIARADLAPPRPMRPTWDEHPPPEPAPPPEKEPLLVVALVAIGLGAAAAVSARRRGAWR